MVYVTPGHRNSVWTPALVSNAMEPGRVTLDEKMVVRKAIEEAGVPFTYVSANCFGGYFIDNLCQLEALAPPKNTVRLYGDGNVKAVFLDEADIGMYTIKAIDDPMTLNKTLYLRPPENILSQRKVIEIWEKMSGIELEKICIPAEELMASMRGITIQIT